MPTEQQPPLPERPKEERERSKKVADILFGGWVTALIAALIFSTQVVSIGVLLFGGLLAALLLGSPATRQNLQDVFQNKDARTAVSFFGPAMILGGVFTDGEPAVMLTTLGIFALGLVLAALRGSTLLGAGSALAPSSEPAPSPLPEQSLAAGVPMPDVRQLCRGLPAALSGEVMQTVEQLEAAAVQARQSGDARRTFDAEQALTDYLPQTVTAWKEQEEENRHPDELLSALAQIRAIAGGSAGQSETARQQWEIQQRFLLEKSADLETAK